MDPTLSLGRICLGENFYGSSSEKVKGHGDWNAPEYTDITGSKEKKVTKALSFYKMEMDEVSERYIAPCFANGLEAYDGEINLALDENLISNEYAVKLCLDYEVKKGNKIVKKELIVALKGELYFVKFIINPKEDDVELGVIFGRSFMRLVNGIVDFGSGVITFHPEEDPFKDDSEKTEKSMDDWDQLLDFNFDDIPQLDGEELLPFICKMGKSSHNKKRGMENLNLFYLDIRTSSSIGRHLTQEEATKEALTLRISQKFTLLEEMRPVIETIAYHDKYNKSDSDDEEEYEIKRNKFGAPIYGSKPASYLNCNDPTKRSLALQAVINPFWKISVWKKAVSFLGSLLVPLQHVNWKTDYKGCYTNEEEAKDSGTMGGNDDEAGSSRSKRSRQYKTVEEVLLPQVHHEFLLWEGCNRDAKSRYNTKLANLLPRHVYSPCVVNWDVLNRMGCDGEIDDMLKIKLREAESNEEIFTSVAWIRDFNIKEPIYSELCHEFYSTYKLDEVCADDELKTKKIIKFRLGGHAHNLTLLEFACRLGLYHAEEIDEDGFDVHFQGSLRSDDHFNAQEYCLSISREENLSLSRSHASTIRNPFLRVMHKMITYGLCQRTTGYDEIQNNDLWLLSMFDARYQNGYANVAWLIVRWIKRKGAGTQKESQICYGHFITKLAKKLRVLSDEVLRSLSAPIYCRDLDTITLRELIDFEGRLILEDPQPGVLRFGILRPPRASMYAGVFENMAGVYSVDLQEAYNPPGYAQPQTVGALKEAKEKLEKQLDGLTWHLQLETRLKPEKAQDGLKDKGKCKLA
ncbi:hypothetical protein Tco_0052969 [Tanacetum coccineum]